MPRKPSCWAAVLALCLWVGPAKAEPEKALLVLAHPRAPALLSALALELDGHGIRWQWHAPSSPQSRPSEQDMRALGRSMGCAFVVWTTGASLRASLTHTERMSEAPLPQGLDQLDSRTFAAVAGSLVLELQNNPTALPPATPRLADAAPIPPTQAPEIWRQRRFFLRAGPALGAAVVTTGLAADRLPPVSLMNQAREAPDPQQLLYSHGFDCETARLAGDALLARDCTVAVRQQGVVRSWGLELALGMDVAPRFSLALLARLTPEAGQGRLAHAVLGLQGEWLLTRPKDRGAWAKLGLGLGVGQIQVRPASDQPGSAGPFVRSGRLDARAGPIFGYRFHPGVGVFLGCFVHRFFPDVLWVVDTSAGLELRL